MKALREARIAAGLTQRELGWRCGTTQSAIARLEAGQRSPSVRTLEEIAEALDMRLVVRFENLDRDEPIESGEMAAPFVEQQSPGRLTGPSDDAPVSSDDILKAGESPPFIQVGMVLRPAGAAGATIPSAGDGGFNDGPRTVVAVEKPFGEPAYAKLVPGYQNSATLQERSDWLRKYWVLVNDFDTSAESLHLATDLP